MISEVGRVNKANHQKNKAMNNKLSNSVVVTSEQESAGGSGIAAIRLRNTGNLHRNDGLKMQSNTGENYQKLSLLK